MDDNHSRPGPHSGIPDRLGLVGLVLFMVIILSTLGASLGNNDSSEQGKASEVRKVVSPTAAIIASGSTVEVEEEPTQTTVPTNRPTNTPTNTATSSPSPSNTPTETATSTPQNTSTATVPPTASATSLPTTTPVPTSTPLPLPTPQGSISRTLRVPILMYHYISIPPEGADKYRVDLSVSPDNFRRQIAYLSENGYNSITLYDLSRAIANKQELPPKPVIITIDDGYRDNYENAYPILQEHNFVATIFLATDFLDRGDPNYLTWEMVKEMADNGIDIEPHSKTHPDLSGKERDFIVYQVLGSQETIEAHTGRKPRYFAYPSGQYDEQVLEVVEELDFWGAVTTNGGVWHGYNERYEWTRVRIRDITNILDFADLLE